MKYLDLAESEAVKRGGHLTLMRFTTGWKAVFGTPWLEPSGDDYAYVLTLRTATSVEDACQDLLMRERVINSHGART